jgi:hypothetical protein
MASVVGHDNQGNDVFARFNTPFARGHLLN